MRHCRHLAAWEEWIQEALKCSSAQVRSFLPLLTWTAWRHIRIEATCPGQREREQKARRRQQAAECAMPALRMTWEFAPLPLQRLPGIGWARFCHGGYRLRGLA